MSVPWWTEFSWLTVEVRAFYWFAVVGTETPFGPVQCLTATCCYQTNACAAWYSHSKKDEPEDKLHQLIFLQGKGTSARACRITSHFAASLVFISNLLNCGKRGQKVIPWLDLWLWQVLPSSVEPDHSGFAVCKQAGNTAVASRKCTLSLSSWRDWNSSAAPQNLACFLDPARHREESPWDIIPTTWPCVCVCEVTISCKRVHDVRVCASACRLQWLHAGCWKQTELGSAWCHGNLQRSSLSLVFSSTVGAYRSDIIGYTLYSDEPESTNFVRIMMK